MQQGLYQKQTPWKLSKVTPSVTLAAACSGAFLSLSLEQENASSSGGLIAENLSRISQVAEMDDLTLAAATC